MENILHIQPMTRQSTTPMSIGHADYIHVGEMVFEGEEDPLGYHASTVMVGCPLESVDHGSHRSHVPLVKTFEYMPDITRQSGNVYLETIHYLKDNKYLIPIRTKMQSGRAQGDRISHLPSLNFARKDLGGMDLSVQGARGHIVSELMDKDTYFQTNHRHPIMDWIRDDLSNRLFSNTVTESHFCASHLTKAVDRYRQRVCRTPHDHSGRHLSEILKTIDIDGSHYPLSMASASVIAHPLRDVGRFVVGSPVDLKSFGRIQIEKLPRIDKDPWGFRDIADLMDNVPLTDFNIDVVVSPDHQILLRHENIAVNRMACFADHEIGQFGTQALLGDLVDERTLIHIRKLFLKYHTQLDAEIQSILYGEAIKLKLIKTIEDEACILLYRYNSTHDEEPLCGVYFDIALQAFAPISIIPEPLVY